MRAILPTYLEDLVLITIPIIWLYGAIGLIFLFFSHSSQITTADYIQTFILVTLTVTLIVSVRNQKKNETYIESKEYLERSVELAEKAYSILRKEDGKLTNNRVSWVSAARLIQRSLFLSTLISLKAHQDIYEAERDFHRHKFLKLLSLDQSGNIFTFYTGENIHKYMHSHQSDFPVGSDQDMIPIVIMSTICRFATFPEGYEDPLEVTENLNHEELEKLYISGSKGLVKYFLFRKYFTVNDDQLITKLPGGNEYRTVNASEVKELLDSKMDAEFPITMLHQ